MQRRWEVVVMGYRWGKLKVKKWHQGERVDKGEEISCRREWGKCVVGKGGVGMWEK